MLLALYFVSGFTSLTFEVLWLRGFAIVLGGTIYAMSCVTTAFMAGLALGSFAADRRLKKSPAARPLRLYGLVEALAGLTGALVVWSLFRHADFYIRLLGPGAGAASDFALTFALIVVPTALMGATFPILALEYRDRRPLAKLYGFNTVGAAFGSLAASFVLIYYLGCLRSAFVAAALNLAIGAAAWLYDGRRAPEASVAPAAPRTHAAAPRLAALLAVVSGFVVLSAEIAWFRYLSLFLGNRVYVTSVVLFIILYCLGFGARLVHQKLATRSPMEILSAACLAAVAALAAGSAARGAALQIVVATGSAGDLAARAAALVFLLGAVVVPAVAMGCLFPLALAVGGNGDEAPPGWLYGLNTVAAVAGALVSGYWMMDRVGANGVMALSALLLLILLLAAPFLSAEPDTALRRRRTVAAALLFLIGVVPAARAKLELFSSERTVFVREDAHGLFTIARADDGRLIVMNNNTALAFLFGDERTQFVQETQAYLPLLYARRVDSVLNVGVGYGITAGAMTLFPEVKTIDAVEILPAIVESRERFAPRNFRYWADPRAAVLIADGRQFLASTPKSYDAISVNVTDPYLPGSSSLFSDEFYALVRQRLAPGGVLCQHIFGPDAVSLYHGIARRFKFVRLIRAYENGFTVVASDEPLEPRRPASLDRVLAARRRAAFPPVLNSAAQLVALVRDGERWRAELEAAPPALLNSDDRPELEFRRLGGALPLLHSNN